MYVSKISMVYHKDVYLPNHKDVYLPNNHAMIAITKTWKHNSHEQVIQHKCSSSVTCTCSSFVHFNWHIEERYDK